MADQSDLEDFVRAHLRSVWALEILLVLRRDRERVWRPAELVDELRASAGLVTDNLRRLQAAALVAAEGEGYRFAPAGAELEARCAELEAAFRERPVAVINMIARPVDPLQSLADAFKFKGGDK